MNKTKLTVIMLGSFALGLMMGACLVLVGVAHADTVLTVLNGAGSTRSQDQALFFYDANQNYVWLDGSGHYVVLKGAVINGYTQTGSFPAIGASSLITGTFSATDTIGAYTAHVSEILATRKVTGGSGKGGGYKTSVTSVVSGSITYDYATAVSAAPLVSGTLTGTSTVDTVTLNWTATTGGYAPYTYSLTQNSSPVSVSGLTSTQTGLASGTQYNYVLSTTDAAGTVASTTFAISTLVPPPPPQPAPTLNTVLVCNTDGTTSVSWDSDPNAVSYSVFVYDWTPGTWIDAADTTGNSATIQSTGTNGIPYISIYVASYDVNGNETDWDQQNFPGCSPAVVSTGGHHTQSDD